MAPLAKSVVAKRETLVQVRTQPAGAEVRLTLDGRLVICPRAEGFLGLPFKAKKIVASVS
jgi:hypothetical protein